MPTANELSGISLVTTLPAPIYSIFIKIPTKKKTTQFFPIFTPGHTTTLPPIQQLSPISIGLAYSSPVALTID